MDRVTFTELRRRMARCLDQVTEDRQPLLITRRGGKGNVVILSEAEFEGWRETFHLLSSPANAARLMESVRQARAGGTEERSLLDPGSARP